MRALVTGAAGFIGAHVAAALARDGAAVRGFDLGAPPAGLEVEEWVTGDVTDAGALARAADGCDAVFHLAALYSYFRRDAEAMMRVNVEGTRSALAAAGERRLVLTSSAATCGPVPGRPADERDSPPDWELKVAYKRSKLESERLALGGRRGRPRRGGGQPDHPRRPGRPAPHPHRQDDPRRGGRPRARPTCEPRRSTWSRSRTWPAATRSPTSAAAAGRALPARRRGPAAARACSPRWPGWPGGARPRRAVPFRPLLAAAWAGRPRAGAVRARAEAARARRGAAGPPTGELLERQGARRAGLQLRAPRRQALREAVEDLVSRP